MAFHIKILLIFLQIIHLSYGDHHLSSEKSKLTLANCDLSPTLVAEIANYTDVANQIFKTILSGSFKGKTYNDLAEFVDKFGPRISGSQTLENSIDFMMKKMEKDGLENVRGEKVKVPHWIRGYENAKLLTPRVKNIEILGLGLSVGTTPLGIIGEVLVVNTFEELKQKASKAKGKIIVFNQVYTDYHETVVYRQKGAEEAGKYGGIAALVRSITPVSINSPHTGVQYYSPNVTKIPVACITVEDAELLRRLQNQGETMKIHLTMIDFTLPEATSRNVIGEIKGREKPDEVVIVSGHIDSWDVGDGSMDDGGGIFVSEEALAVLNFLKLRPRRTIRAVLWTTEEFGLYGVKAYVKQHKSELEKLVAAFESDIGTFKPLGLDFAGSDKSGCIVQEVLKLLKPINATTFRTFSSVGSDIDDLIKEGVPGLSLNTANDKYFWYHHTQGDTLAVENTDELDLCTAVWAVSSYVIADLSVTLPRT